MESTKEITINVPEIEPRLKHQTIFDTFKNLEAKQSMIIHNDHDPVPVYYQLQNIYGDCFTWEYLQEGPDWWDIRVTKKGEVQQAITTNDQGETVIIAPNLHPGVKHQTILSTFLELEPGKAMIIHNDHDPKPLYFQMQRMYGDIFTWEYEQAGPDWWDVRVTKKGLDQAVQTTEEGEIIIYAPELEPRVKHETILNTFRDLEDGKTMIIVNDHDPKPLYFQMSNMFSDPFTWEYAQEGPETWEVRVTKGAEETTDNKEETGEPELPKDAVYKNTMDETVVYVPKLPAKIKHPTIFKVFESLKEDESMIIHNDHDPKPLYYQLLADHGEVFTWEYLQEGPQWWDIRITLTGYNTEETIGDITAKDFRKASVFKKYGIDFCCRGDRTVTQACKEMGIDVKEVEKDLQKVDEATSGGYTNYDDWNLDFLADYITNTHHQYVKKNAPEILGYAKKVANVHGANHPELNRIRDLVQFVHDEMMEHMVEEDDILFPTVKKILEAEKTNTPRNADEVQKFVDIVNKSEEEHQEVGDAMHEIRHKTENYTLPDDACASYTLLYKMLEDFEADLFTHIHLENNILFPKAVKIEQEMV